MSTAAAATSESTNTPLPYESLEETARKIEQSIIDANKRIYENTRTGVQLSEKIAQGVERDLYLKKQRYNIFISKMEQLASSEQFIRDYNATQLTKMEFAYVNGKSPLKDILMHYSKASKQGFDSKLVSETLTVLKQALRARGNIPRAFDDYNMHEFDSSWRMQQLTSHIKNAMDEEMYFNHYYMGLVCRQLGEIGHKDTELIQKTFDKLNILINERESNKIRSKAPLDFEQAVYGGFKNHIPRHYVFDGFESNQEFAQHLHTLMQWQVEQNDGLGNLGVIQTQEVEELEQHMAQLIYTATTIQDMQVNLQASFDSMRQQFFRLMETKDKHTFLAENKYVYYELLQLQELLVKGGYLTPEEAQKIDPTQKFNDRMRRASHIFYEYCQNFAPELMSEQYFDFFKASRDSQLARTKVTSNLDLNEKHDLISVGSLSQSLIGLSQQALSFRKDAQDKDFLHKFYEDHVTRDNIKDEDHELYNQAPNFESYNVKMKQEYLRGFYIFEKEAEKILPRLIKLINKSPNDTEGLLHALAALSACNHDEPETRLKIFKNLERLMANKSEQIRTQPLIDGLVGIALQGYQDSSSTNVAKKILQRLDNLQVYDFTFDQKLDVLWAASVFGFVNNQIVRDLFVDLNHLNFQNTNHDLTYQQFERVLDIMVYFNKVASPQNRNWAKKVTNSNLNLLMKNPHYQRQRFDETSCDFDPFKLRVLQGLATGLTNANIEHSMVLQDNILQITNQNLFFDEELTPYKPDLIVGLDGQKVYLNVIPASQTMKDTKRPNGLVLHRQNMLKALSKTPIETVSIPLNSIVNYDIPNLKIEMKSDYNFIQDLTSQLSTNSNTLSINFEPLSGFGARFSKIAADYVESLVLESDKRRIDLLFKQLKHVFDIKFNTQRQFESSQQQQGLNQLKFELMKLNLYFDNLPDHQKQVLNGCLPQGFTSFESLIKKCRESLNSTVYTPKTFDEQLKSNWMGTRLEVELPVSTKSKLKKNIAPELLNQRFMWVDDYFHYSDWEEQMKSVYDSFNLLVVPRDRTAHKFYFDKQSHMRIVPQGIFPPPNDKRRLQRSLVNEAPRLHSESGDVINQFEKEPYKIMINNELERSKKLNDVTSEIRYMTNLQNIKQGLKRDYSDQQIMDLLFNNLSLTDQLIEEHLNFKQDKDEPQFVSRVPSCYREFVKKTYQSKDQEDPFTHFFIKESGKIERIHRVKEQEMAKYEDFIKHNDNLDSTENTQKHILNTLQEKMDDMLMQNRNENEDFLSIGHHLNSEVKITYNLNSLIKSEFVYDVDPELINPEITDAAFLFNQRRRAETKLIKSKIIYKMHNDLNLTQNEKSYLRAWMKDLGSNQSLNISNHRDSMLNRSVSNLKINDLKAEDLFALNQIPNVHLDREALAKFAVNDLVLELSHLLDEETINRVELEMMAKRIRSDWQLPDDFQIIETRNKEIGLLLNQMEEVAWRTSGMINEGDMESLQRVLSVGRNQDYFDRQFYNQDMQSLSDFVNQVNRFDDRAQLLEEWIYRKEKEIESRTMLPSKGLKQSDSKLFAEIDKDLKAAREKIVAKLLDTDEFGNQQPSKEYKDLTTKDLERITEAVCVRLNQFNGEYPAFMPHTVKAIMEHPNLTRIDYDKLNTFSRMFELDWRGDRSIENKLQFLATNPVYVSKIDRLNTEDYENHGNMEVISSLRFACTSFVPQIVDKMQHAQK